jgi:hypothetical protein
MQATYLARNKLLLSELNGARSSKDLMKLGGCQM